MVKAVSKVFKKGTAENFKSILKQQKKDESDPKFAISDALQEYQSQLEKSAGYTSQAKLNKANIRQEIIDFVIYYPINELDALKGMDFDDAKTQQKTTEKTIKEYENLRKKDIITEEELAYIQETVGKTNIELKKILGLSTKLSLGFRDFKKELKPLKLAKRIGLTNVPIIGKRIERAIESDERAEAKGLQTKRQLRKKESKGALKQGGKSAGPTTSAGKEDISKRVTAKSMGMDSFKSEGGFGGDSEDKVEEERESDAQFDTTSGLLEKIYEEQKTTNELLGDSRKESSGLLSGIATSLLAGGGIATAIAAMRTSMIARFRSLGNVFRKGFGMPLKGSKVNQKSNRAMMNQANERKNKTKTRIRTTTGSRVGAVGSQMNQSQLKSSMKTGNLVAANKKKGMKVAMSTAGKAVRAGGRFLWPVAALMSVFDAASGVANAGELLGKEDEDLTFKDKASAGFAGFLSGLTFGLLDKEKMAKKFAGDGPTAEEIAATQSHSRMNLYSNHPMAKNKRVDELKELEVEKLTIKDKHNPRFNVINNNNNVDNSQNTSNTNLGSSTIGTGNPDQQVKELTFIP